MSARWPLAEVFGEDVTYCPVCHQPEPDGLPVVEAYEITDMVMCGLCWEAVRQSDDPEGAAAERADDLEPRY